MESPEPEVSAVTEVKKHLDAMLDLWRDLCEENDSLKRELFGWSWNDKDVEMAMHLNAIEDLCQELSKENDQLKYEKAMEETSAEAAEIDGASVPPGPMDDDA